MLPCASCGGPADEVCQLLSEISRELLESSGAPAPGGAASLGHAYADPSSACGAPGVSSVVPSGPGSGCDSSDCLFCQYRSNSPFHLHAYAGKLTSLLRKRHGSSLSGALGCGQGAAEGQLGGSKRLRPAPALSVQACPSPAPAPAPAPAPDALQPPLGAGAEAEGSDGGSAGLGRSSLDSASREEADSGGRSAQASTSPSPPPVESPQQCTPGSGSGSGSRCGGEAGPPPEAPTRQAQLGSGQGSSGPPPGLEADSRGCGLAPLLPPGWSFRSEWAHRRDPAPARLAEVLRLPRGGGAAGPGAGGWGAGRVAGHQSDIVCALEFSPDGRLLSSGGVDKQIRTFNLSGLLESRWSASSEEEGGEEAGEGGAGRHAALRKGGRGGGCAAGEQVGAGPCGELLVDVQRLASKISSMAWSPYQDGVLTVGDYDGSLLQLHLGSGHQLADVDAHGGRKVWSVAHSPHAPHLVASAADDRAARLWGGAGLESCVAVLRPNPRAAVCGVDFCPDPSAPHLLALAAADRAAYVYDLRHLAGGPLAVLRHHSRPAAYVRFLGGGRLVSAATDASLALWDLRGALGLAGGGGAGAGAGAGGGEPVPSRVFGGHRNEKNFVGLSVRPRDGLIACGSECSRAFAFHTSWSEPLAALDLLGLGAGPGPGGGLGGGLPSRQSSLADPLCAPAAQPQPLGPACAPAFPLPPPAACGPLAGGGGSMRRRSSTGGGSGSFVSAVCWQPGEAAEALGLPPLLASATSFGGVSLSVLAACGL